MLAGHSALPAGRAPDPAPGRLQPRDLQGRQRGRHGVSAGGVGRAVSAAAAAAIIPDAPQPIIAIFFIY